MVGVISVIVIVGILSWLYLKEARKKKDKVYRMLRIGQFDDRDILEQSPVR